MASGCPFLAGTLGNSPTNVLDTPAPGPWSPPALSAPSSVSSSALSLPAGSLSPGGAFVELLDGWQPGQGLHLLCFLAVPQSQALSRAGSVPLWTTSGGPAVLPLLHVH